MACPQTQKALVFSAPGEPFEIKKRPVPKPGPGQVLVKIISTALNPIDEIIRARGLLVTQYPAIVGNDAAGTVVALDDGVDNFKVGDRVLFQNWLIPDRGTYQQYALSDAGTTAKIPENISFDAAATLPMALATAALGLYGGKANAERGGAGLLPAWEESGANKFLGEPIFITGGAGSVGQVVIQMAKLSGFNPIITTASSQHTEYCKLAGATDVIDYRTIPYRALPSAISTILSTTAKPLRFIYDCISDEETVTTCWDILAPSGNLIVTRRPSNYAKVVMEHVGEEGKNAYFVAGNVNFPTNKEVGESLYGRLEEMLRDGRIKPNHFEVVPGGLAAIADALVGRVASGKTGGVKLVVRPQETA